MRMQEIFLPSPTVMASFLFLPSPMLVNTKQYEMKWEIQQSIRTIDQGRMMQQPTTDHTTTINAGGEVLFHHFFSIVNKHTIQQM